MDDVRPWLALTLVPGVSLGAQRKLLAHFGSAQAIADAGERKWTAVIAPDEARALAAGPAPALVDRTLEWLEGANCHLLRAGSPGYPEMFLHNIHDAPVAFYARGRIELLQSPSLAIVGSRNASRTGSQDAHYIARALSDAGLAIVSGLALGIDAAAHRGGLAGKSSSVAVLGTGADTPYPPRNAGLFDQLAAEGCVVSEFPLGTPPAPWNFPRRNRLISGLSRGVLVVEAALASGSLITAKYAADQGREVFALPGSIHSTLSKGCHWLIKEGAKLVETADDVLVELNLAAPKTAESPGEEPPESDPLLEALGYAPMSIDEFVMHTGLGAATLAARLTRLELEGRVELLPGGRFRRSARREIE